MLRSGKASWVNKAVKNSIVLSRKVSVSEKLKMVQAYETLPKEEKEQFISEKYRDISKLEMSKSTSMIELLRQKRPASRNNSVIQLKFLPKKVVPKDKSRSLNQTKQKFDTLDSKKSIPMLPNVRDLLLPEKSTFKPQVKQNKMKLVFYQKPKLDDSMDESSFSGMSPFQFQG